MANVTDPAIADAYAEISNLRGSTNWVLLGYTNNTTLQVAGKGSGGVGELVHLLQDDGVNYGLVRVTFTADDETERTKFIFFAWAGANSSVLKRGKISVHKASVKTIFKDFAVEFQTDSREDLTEESLVKHVKRVNY